MKILLVVLALGALCVSPAMAQWVEQGDAGDLPGTAQIPVGSGALTTISGSLGASDADMYCITIDDPGTVRLETCIGTSIDTQLFLFTPDGIGVGMNDDACSLQSAITTATMACPNATGSGQYFLAVSRYNRDPVDANGQTLWVSGTQEHCADGTGANNPVAGWSGTTSAGDYLITLTAVSYCETTATDNSTWSSLKSLYR